MNFNSDTLWKLSLGDSILQRFLLTIKLIAPMDLQPDLNFLCKQWLGSLTTLARTMRVTLQGLQWLPLHAQIHKHEIINKCSSEDCETLGQQFEASCLVYNFTFHPKLKCPLWDFVWAFSKHWLMGSLIHTFNSDNYKRHVDWSSAAIW